MDVTSQANTEVEGAVPQTAKSAQDPHCKELGPKYKARGKGPHKAILRFDNSLERQS